MYNCQAYISLKDLVLTYTHRINAVIIMNYMLITILKQLYLPLLGLLVGCCPSNSCNNSNTHNKIPSLTSPSLTEHEVVDIMILEG